MFPNRLIRLVNAEDSQLRDSGLKSDTILDGKEALITITSRKEKIIKVAKWHIKKKFLKVFLIVNKRNETKEQKKPPSFSLGDLNLSKI